MVRMQTEKPLKAGSFQGSSSGGNSFQQVSKTVWSLYVPYMCGNLGNPTSSQCDIHYMKKAHLQ